MRDCVPAALLLDMDGVLYHGLQVLPQAREFLAAVARVPRLFITNNPIATPAQVADRLESMGFERPGEQDILTSGVAAARWLHERTPGFRYFAVGAGGLDAELSRCGTADSERADYVVVGEGAGLDYASLTTGINLVLKHGAQLISTNPDPTVDGSRDGEHLLLPGGGALVAAFEVACGCKAITIGKPEPLLFEMALQRLGVAPGECVMIGDRVDTDIAGAQRLGMRTAMVRTGRFAPGDPWPQGQAPADWDVESLDGLLQAWRARWPGWA
jgi:HAD superfamily hydrolase (TIGR01450 family)